MKKFLFLILSLFLLSACKSRKTESKNVGLKKFYAYYNTLFNSKDALENELNNRKSSHQDNFYAPYIRLLTYDEQPLGADIDNSDSFFEGERNQMLGSRSSGSDNQEKTLSVLQISEAKAQKAISKYSVMRDGIEKNKELFNANILLAQARLYQNKPLEALDALNYIFVHMRKDKRLPLANIYQGYAYTILGDYYRADEVFRALKDEKLKKSYAKLLSIYYSEMLLASGKKEETVDELEEAFKLNKNRTLRSRIAFLRGQILSQLGRNEEARESFVSAYKYANDFEFEVKSQIEIAKTFDGKSDSYEGAKEYLEKISKKGVYVSRKNEFDYALGLMALKAGKKEEAREYFQKSVKEKQSDPQIRGLAYSEIAKDYFDKDDYIASGAYYDSALAVMTYKPVKDEIASLTGNIKKITKNYYLIKKNDSILALTKMPEPERIAYFNKYINQLKEKEAKEEAERKKAERSAGFDNGDYSANSIFANTKTGLSTIDFSTGSKNKSTFYFANSNTVSSGASSFKQTWGNRARSDNWRYSGRSATIEDVKNKAMGIASVQDPRRFEPGFYIEKIPTDKSEIATLKKDRDTASLGLGRMYENFFGKTALATKTLYDLVDQQPEEDIKLQALYQIFAMNYEKNPTAAERAKNMILSEYPYTSYAEFVRNPKSNTFSASQPEVEKAYKDAFNLYTEEKYEDSKKLIEESLQKYPKDALVPKFALLNAFNTGKTAGKEIMILQLEQIALNYPKTQEGLKAKDMLNYLKSNLTMELTNEKNEKVKEVQQASKQTPSIKQRIGQPGKNEDQTTSAEDETLGPPSEADVPGNDMLRRKSSSK